MAGYRKFARLPEPCADSLDQRAQGLCFVAAEIIEGDDVSLPQDGQEQLLDIGVKALFANRTVEDAECGDLIRAQHTKAGQGPSSAPPGQAPKLWRPNDGSTSSSRLSKLRGPLAVGVGPAAKTTPATQPHRNLDPGSAL